MAKPDLKGVRLKAPPAGHKSISSLRNFHRNFLLKKIVVLKVELPMARVSYAIPIRSI